MEVWNWVLHNQQTVLLVATFALSILASIIGTSVYVRWADKRPKRKLNKIMNLGNDRLLLVFDYRHDRGTHIIPRMATEDFLALNRITNLLLKLHWKGNVGVRLAHKVTDDDKRKNIISICSAKSNKFSREIQDMLVRKGVAFFRVEKAPNAERWRITDGLASYDSRSYEQVQRVLDDGGEVYELISERFDDVAVITKITNPWNMRNKIIMIAGVRGIGTWAAAHCLENRWNEIYRNLPRGRKDSDFSAVLRVTYDDLKIVSVQIARMLPIDLGETLKGE